MIKTNDHTVYKFSKYKNNVFLYWMHPVFPFHISLYLESGRILSTYVLCWVLLSIEYNKNHLS